MSRRPEAHLGYGVILTADEVTSLGSAAKAMALKMSRADRGTYDKEFLRYAELGRLWRQPELKPEEDFSVSALLDELGMLHGVAVFDVPSDPENDYDAHDHAVVYRETLREQRVGYVDTFVLPEVPEDVARLADFLHRFGFIYKKAPRWIFGVTDV